ncbi:hypothetical protein ADL21_06355 [Streptomyces albus subsp. albus]|nr:hypothetical protein ADL21_06355 [Streptomyces albus subsp. albus]
MSGPDPLSPQAQVTVARAQLVLADAESVPLRVASRADLYKTVGALAASVRALLGVVDRMPRPSKSERLAAQQDEQFRNLLRAARREVPNVQGALARLDGFVQALDDMLRAGGDR